jgi:hypothetical protein
MKRVASAVGEVEGVHMTWECLNPNVALVADSGYVVALANGHARILVSTFTGSSAPVDVIVDASPAGRASIAHLPACHPITDKKSGNPLHPTALGTCTFAFTITDVAVIRAGRVNPIGKGVQ